MKHTLLVLALTTSLHAGDPGWKRHTIDNTSRGADGIRVADVNRDGLPDLTVGWEEGGVVRVYLNPGEKSATKPWPQVTVGRVKSPEDAVFVDLDGDGVLDVVSSCEGKTRTMFVHWGPKDAAETLDGSKWKTEPIPDSVNAQLWMFCLPMQVDGKHGIDLVTGSKGSKAAVGWWEAPANPRDLSQWKWHRIDDAGWIMSLIKNDVDGDGDDDIVISDRKGKRRGCRWLENPGPSADQTKKWKPHDIGGQGKEVMFLGRGDLNNDKLEDLICPTYGNELLYFQRHSTEPKWSTEIFPLPPETGTGKAAALYDVNNDGWQDILFTCGNSKGKAGVMWLEQFRARGSEKPRWAPHEICGRKKGVKFDLIQLLDLDGDGDLDLLTCEERDNLGVIWYENPTK